MRIIIGIILCLSLTSCAYYKQTLIRARGKDISVPIGSGIMPVKGKGVVISVFREVFLMPGKAEIQPFTDIQKFVNIFTEDEIAVDEVDNE